VLIEELIIREMLKDEDRELVDQLKRENKQLRLKIRSLEQKASLANLANDLAGLCKLMLLAVLIPIMAGMILIGLIDRRSWDRLISP
jgi:hypothetical protein